MAEHEQPDRELRETARALRAEFEALAPGGLGLGGACRRCATASSAASPGALSGLLKSLGQLADAERRELGQELNALKAEIEARLAEARARLEARLRRSALARERARRHAARAARRARAPRIR